MRRNKSREYNNIQNGLKTYPKATNPHHLSYNHCLSHWSIYPISCHSRKNFSAKRKFICTFLCKINNFYNIFQIKPVKMALFSEILPVLRGSFGSQVSENMCKCQFKGILWYLNWLENSCVRETVLSLYKSFFGIVHSYADIYDKHCLYHSLIKYFVFWYTELE